MSASGRAGAPERQTRACGRLGSDALHATAREAVRLGLPWKTDLILTERIGRAGTAGTVGAVPPQAARHRAADPPGGRGGPGGRRKDTRCAGRPFRSGAAGRARRPGRRPVPVRTGPGRRDDGGAAERRPVISDGRSAGPRVSAGTAESRTTSREPSRAASSTILPIACTELEGWGLNSTVVCPRATTPRSIATWGSSSSCSLRISSATGPRPVGGVSFSRLSAGEPVSSACGERGRRFHSEQVPMACLVRDTVIPNRHWRHCGQATPFDTGPLATALPGPLRQLPGVGLMCSCSRVTGNLEWPTPKSV